MTTKILWIVIVGAVVLELICKHIIYLIISDIQYLLMIFARHLHNEDGNCF